MPAHPNANAALTRERSPVANSRRELDQTTSHADTSPPELSATTLREPSVLEQPVHACAPNPRPGQITISQRQDLRARKNSEFGFAFLVLPFLHTPVHIYACPSLSQIAWRLRPYWLFDN